MHRILFLMITAIFFSSVLLGQVPAEVVRESNDSVPSGQINFTPISASDYIQKTLILETLWKTGNDSLKVQLGRLVDQYSEAYDSIEQKLSQIDLHASEFRTANSYLHDTLHVKWLNDSTFIIDTVELDRQPMFMQKTVIQKITDSIVYISKSSSTGVQNDSLLKKTDTIIHNEDITFEVIIDTAYLQQNGIQLYNIRNKKIVPSLLPANNVQSYRFLKDGSKIVISEPIHVIVADAASPFNIVPNWKLADSLDAAMQTLLAYTNKRDSLPLYLTSLDGSETQFWLTVEENELQRYWIKNYKDDSVSIWMGNPDKQTISFALEDDISIKRIEKALVDIPFTKAVPLVKMVKVEPLKEIPVFWDFDFSSSFSLSENYLTNWAKGGESSLASLVDISGLSKYTNKEAKTEWNGSARLKYGSVITQENGMRKNTDILELDSKYNKEIQKKIAFSTLFHFKSQVAVGKKYPNDSTEITVSRFLNPATFTIGAGFEYKPLKKSTINVSLLSYKNTFVLDTANIPQTDHGIDKDKRAKQEMGGQMLIKSELTFFDDLKLKNSLRLFSNYLEKPENIDIEWEMSIEKQLSLYFTILLNMHMIYDDNIRFSVLDANEKPILLPDGSEKKVPKMQFKQFLGVTFLIKI